MWLVVSSRRQRKIKIEKKLDDPIIRKNCDTQQSESYFHQNVVHIMLRFHAPELEEEGKWRKCREKNTKKELNLQYFVLVGIISATS